MTGIYPFEAVDIKGTNVKLDNYRGQVLLVVNTASKCGFTPQFAGLEKLYEKFRERGFAVLGFPCNQFGHQDPGNNGEIAEFCQMNYGVSFPMFAKIDVNGPDTHPLFQHLKTSAPGLLGSEKIKWNFTKFLIDREGKVIARFAPLTKPEAIEQAVQSALA
ncbi:MAG TPA: glutathione peroxidase [Spongiibacteraceae bacterium]|jgi:glutathione peroxidase|nr:glutathione peroxidase [Spongiibacteraceae bacterium]